MKCTLYTAATPTASQGVVYGHPMEMEKCITLALTDI